VLAGAVIALAARVTARTDVFDALPSDPPYRRACPVTRPIRSLEESGSRHFDPGGVDASLRMHAFAARAVLRAGTPGLSFAAVARPETTRRRCALPQRSRARARGARRAADTVTLWVRERGGGAWLGGGCNAAAIASSCRATVNGLAPGTYVVRLEDSNQGRRPRRSSGTGVIPAHG
jgi:hypothetical protein